MTARNTGHQATCRHQVIAIRRPNVSVDPPALTRPHPAGQGRTPCWVMIRSGLAIRSADSSFSGEPQPKRQAGPMVRRGPPPTPFGFRDRLTQRCMGSTRQLPLRAAAPPVAAAHDTTGGGHSAARLFAGQLETVQVLTAFAGCLPVGLPPAVSEPQGRERRSAAFAGPGVIRGCRPGADTPPTSLAASAHEYRHESRASPTPCLRGVRWTCSPAGAGASYSPPASQSQ
jgi:hypothetical protein